jgi:hypothetical protein
VSGIGCQCCEKTPTHLNAQRDLLFCVPEIHRFDSNGIWPQWDMTGVDLIVGHSGDGLKLGAFLRSQRGQVVGINGGPDDIAFAHGRWLFSPKHSIAGNAQDFFAAGDALLDQALAVVAHQGHAGGQSGGADVGFGSVAVDLGASSVIDRQ